MEMKNPFTDHRTCADGSIAPVFVAVVVYSARCVESVTRAVISRTVIMSNQLTCSQCAAV